MGRNSRISEEVVNLVFTLKRDKEWSLFHTCFKEDIGCMTDAQ